MKARHFIILAISIMLTVMVWQDWIEEHAYYNGNMPYISIAEWLYKLLIFPGPIYLAIFYSIFYGAYFIIRESINLVRRVLKKI